VKVGVEVGGFTIGVWKITEGVKVAVGFKRARVGVEVSVSNAIGTRGWAGTVRSLTWQPIVIIKTADKRLKPNIR
jgi:hypothetical protein